MVPERAFNDLARRLRTSRRILPRATIVVQLADLMVRKPDLHGSTSGHHSSSMHESFMHE
jgi:hypothetical protein